MAEESRWRRVRPEWKGERVDWLVRTVDPSDRDAILGVARAAFTGDGRDGQEEIDIVIATWKVRGGRPGLELVAVAGDAVIGHLLAGEATSRGGTSSAWRRSRSPRVRAHGCGLGPDDRAAPPR